MVKQPVQPKLETTRRRVVHVTSVHVPRDTRILYRECVALADDGWDVRLLASTATAFDHRGVRVVPLPVARSRLERMTLLPVRVFFAALAQKGEVYHFHDPELLPVALLLRMVGHRVIFDSHEDHVAAMQYRDYLGPITRSAASLAVSLVQRLVLPRLSALIAATPVIEGLLRNYHAKVALVQNFPPLSEFSAQTEEPHATFREPAVVYVGAISIERGLIQMVTAVAEVAERRPCRLLLGGTFSDQTLRHELEASAAWRHVEYVGQLDRDAVYALFARASAGLIVLEPNANYLVSYPTKMFEYMGAGLPVIASDFPIWRPFFERYSCGMLVDSADSSAIAKAIVELLEDPVRGAGMGERGRQAVRAEFNWELQRQSLLSLYHALFERDGEDALAATRSADEGNRSAL